MAKPFLQEIEEYRAARGADVLARETEVLAHEIVDTDYTLKRGRGGFKRIAADLDLAIKAGSLNTQVFQVYRAAWKYLWDPEERAAFKQMVAEGKRYGYLIGVRALIEAGIETWEDIRNLPESVQEMMPEEEVTVELPSNTTTGDAPTPEAPTSPEDETAEKIRDLVGAILDDRARERARVEELEERVAKLEQSNRSLKGENRTLEALLVEVEREREEVEESLDETPALPQEVSLNGSGKKRPLDCSSRFTREFGKMERHDQKRAVKALRRIDSRASEKLEPPALQKFNVPEGTIASRISRLHRLLWRPTPEGTVRVYAIVSRQDYPGAGANR